MKSLRSRQSHRLTGYDYSRNGAYFITIVCQDRADRFGTIVGGEMVLNDAGKMICSAWNDLPEYYNGICVDESIVMPNHFHGIIVINHDDIDRGNYRRGGAPVPTRNNNQNMTLSDVLNRFKSFTTHRYSNGVKMGLVKPFRKRLWQRDYWDHIIRNQNEYNAIRTYIVNNPKSWELDSLRNSRNDLQENRAAYGDDWRSLC